MVSMMKREKKPRIATFLTVKTEVRALLAAVWVCIFF